MGGYNHTKNWCEMITTGLTPDFSVMVTPSIMVWESLFVKCEPHQNSCITSDLTKRTHTHTHLAKIKVCRKGAADSRLVTQGTVSASLGLVSAAHPNMQNLIYCLIQLIAVFSTAGLSLWCNVRKCVRVCLLVCLCATGYVNMWEAIIDTAHKHLTYLHGLESCPVAAAIELFWVGCEYAWRNERQGSARAVLSTIAWNCQVKKRTKKTSQLCPITWHTLEWSTSLIVGGKDSVAVLQQTLLNLSTSESHIKHSYVYRHRVRKHVRGYHRLHAQTLNAPSRTRILSSRCTLIYPSIYGARNVSLVT